MTPKKFIKTKSKALKPYFFRWSFTIQPAQRIETAPIPVLQNIDYYSRLIDSCRLEHFFKHEKFLNCNAGIATCEVGLKESVPHWQCTVRLKNKVSRDDILKMWEEHERDFHEEEPFCILPFGRICGLAPTVNEAASEAYCRKDVLVEVPNGFEPIDFDLSLSAFGDKYSMQSVDLHPWQEHCLDLALTPTGEISDRSIFLFFENLGNIGKSFFVRFILFNQRRGKLPNDIGVIPSNFASAASLAHTLCTLGKKRAYILDLPRSAFTCKTPHDYRELEQLFAVLEGLKNGYISSSFKGEMLELFMPPPQIIVFGNSLPLDFHLPSNRYVQIFKSDVPRAPEFSDEWDQFADLNSKYPSVLDKSEK